MQNKVKQETTPKKKHINNPVQLPKNTQFCKSPGLKKNGARGLDASGVGVNTGYPNMRRAHIKTPITDTNHNLWFPPSDQQTQNTHSASV